MRRKSFLWLLFSVLWIVNIDAQTKQVKTGNQLYEQKKYKEAATTYQEALSKNPTYIPGMFNLGNALFQQKNYDASRQVMSATAKQATDKNVKADANYNIGNTYMQEQKWEEAINSYKQALRNNPQDEAAKYNLSYARAMMKRNENKKDKNKDNKDQKNKDQDKDQKDKQDQNKDQQKKDQKDQNSKDQQNKDGEQKDQKNEEKNKDQDQHQQPQPSKLSKQQADQLLNALAQEEKKLHDKKEKGKATRIKVDKDW